MSGCSANKIALIAGVETGLVVGVSGVLVVALVNLYQKKSIGLKAADAAMIFAMYAIAAALGTALNQMFDITGSLRIDSVLLSFAGCDLDPRAAAKLGPVHKGLQ